MKYSYFKSIAKWAGNKFAEKLGGNGRSWLESYFLPGFRESSKNHSRIYFEGNIAHCDIRDLKMSHRKGPGVWKFESMVSWSFETDGFKPSDQENATLLVFRFKSIKGQKKCTLRIVHQIKK